MTEPIDIYEIFLSFPEKERIHALSCRKGNIAGGGQRKEQ